MPEHGGIIENTINIILKVHHRRHSLYMRKYALPLIFDPAEFYKLS